MREAAIKCLLLFMLLAVGACALPSADEAREAQAERVLEAVRTQDREALERLATNALRLNLTDEALAEMSGYVPEGEPEQARTIFWQSTVQPGRSYYRVLREYRYPETVLTVDTLMARDGDGPWSVDGVHVNSIPASEAALGGFALTGKTPLHYAVLSFTVLAPIICLGTAAFAGVRRRWGWMIGSLFGVGQFAFNWGTGALQFQALNVSILSAGFFKGPAITDPWILSFAIPIPALLFWVLRKWRLKSIGKRAADTAGSSLT